MTTTTTTTTMTLTLTLTLTLPTTRYVFCVCALVNAVVVPRNCRNRHPFLWVQSCFWLAYAGWMPSYINVTITKIPPPLPQALPSPSCCPPPQKTTSSWGPYAANGDVLSAVECRISLTSTTASPSATATASCILQCALCTFIVRVH